MNPLSIPSNPIFGPQSPIETPGNGMWLCCEKNNTLENMKSYEIHYGSNKIIKVFQFSHKNVYFFHIKYLANERKLDKYLKGGFAMPYSFLLWKERKIPKIKLLIKGEVI